MNRVGVIAALPAEAQILSDAPVGPGDLVTPSPHLQLAVCGIGAERAYQAARELLQQPISVLISWGCGAGLIDSAVPGTLFLPERVIDAGSQQTFRVTPVWHEYIASMLRNSGIEFETQSLVSSAELLTDMDAKRVLQQQSGAGIADMESAAVARAATEADCAYVCIRAVADSLAIRLPEALLPALDEFGRPRTIELLRALVQRPSLIPQLMQLAQAFKAARKRLAAVAAATGRLAVDGP